MTETFQGCEVWTKIRNFNFIKLSKNILYKHHNFPSKRIFGNSIPQNNNLCPLASIYAYLFRLETTDSRKIHFPPHSLGAKSKQSNRTYLQLKGNTRGPLLLDVWTLWTRFVWTWALQRTSCLHRPATLTVAWILDFIWLPPEPGVGALFAPPNIIRNW